MAFGGVQRSQGQDWNIDPEQCWNCCKSSARCFEKSMGIATAVLVLAGLGMVIGGAVTHNRTLMLWSIAPFVLSMSTGSTFCCMCCIRKTASAGKHIFDEAVSQ